MADLSQRVTRIWREVGDISKMVVSKASSSITLAGADTTGAARLATFKRDFEEIQFLTAERIPGPAVPKTDFKITDSSKMTRMDPQEAPTTTKEVGEEEAINEER